jgi:hypothetical protein
MAQPAAIQGGFGMAVSPAQRLVSYLREFPLVRAAAHAEAPAATAPAAVVNRPVASERPARPVFTAPAAAPPANLRLPRGSLVNIVT